MADLIILDASSAKIKGESQVKDFKDMIELISYSHNLSAQVTNDQSNTKRTSGKPNIKDFTVTKFQDLSSCKLIDFCLRAASIPDLKIIVGHNDNGKVTKVFTYEMKNALVSSYAVGGGGSGKPHETVTFNFTNITWTYIQQASEVKEAGNMPATWNLLTNDTK
jgi:type VI secretion system secreted protein Hcp